jgi:hypothetical protein
MIIRRKEKSLIVCDEKDWKMFMDRMVMLTKGSGPGFYAFALMTSHEQILLKEAGMAW